MNITNNLNKNRYHLCRSCMKIDICKNSHWSINELVKCDKYVPCRDIPPFKKPSSGSNAVIPMREVEKNERYVVYIVAGYGDDEPVITAFNNEEAAREYEKFAKTKYQNVSFDKAPVYGRFLIGGRE